MTRNVYRTAQGKMIDMGALTLQNETVRAVGNMNVNARGDLVSSTNQVIDQRNRQIQRQVKRRSNVVADPVYTSTVTAKQAAQNNAEPAEETLTPAEEIVDQAIVTPATPVPVDLTVDQAAVPAGGLAAALAKAKTVKQTLDPTAKQQAQAQGVRKL